MTSPTRTTAGAGDEQRERIDPARAAAGLARWRRALADALGADPGARLDRPDRRLVMLRVFGSTRRLAELCLKHPTAAADALVDGASSVLAQTARDLAPLAGGVGGADALYGALSPLKNRADIAIGIAEISGQWSAREATAARADVAERLVDTALAWLLRAAINRGELAASQSEGPVPGVFALAGGDFAQEDLAPYGPLDIAVIYDETLYPGPAARMAERAFVRLGAELREAFEGKPGEYALLSLKTPFGSGVGGAGVAESKARALSTLATPTRGELRAWIGMARVVAGDRRAGGLFLEAAEETIWTGEGLLDDDARAALRRTSDDPREPFRSIASVFRRSFGAARPVFRTASANEVFETAAASGALPQDVALRLAAGSEFAHSVVARAQLIKGTAATAVAGGEEETALAYLCGFAAPDALRATLAGVVADARNTLHRLTDPQLAEFDRYRATGGPDDVDKLADLGFHDGAGLAGVLDQWTALAGASPEKDRFAAIAPGLLTAFGETQHPDAAARLFDQLLRVAPKGETAFAPFAKEGARREGLCAAIGCFDAAVAPLAETEATAKVFFEERGAEIPRSGTEWLARFAPPAAGSDLFEIAAWRKEAIARVALYSASGDMSFDAAAGALEAIGNSALRQVMASVAKTTKGGEHLALHVFDGPARGLPGAPSPFGFIASGGEADKREAFARAFMEGVDALGQGFFAVTPDVSHRPGGVAGGLAPEGPAFKSYIQSEAVAYDQILLSRARVIAGKDAAQDAARAVLRTAVANPKRSEILLRDLDRARAQRLRRDRAASEWDLEQAEGGLHDVELIISTLIYRHAAAQPAVQDAGVDEALDLLARAGAIPQSVTETLKSARAFWTRLATARALARWSDPQREPVRARFAELLARAAEVERFNQVRPIMRGYAEEVTRLYGQLVLGRPSLSLVASA